MKKFLISKIAPFFNNRILVMCCVVIILFLGIIVRLYNLQIIHGEEYDQELRQTTNKLISIPAPRGSIYDKFGRPLATNESHFTLKLDTDIKMQNMNQVVFDLINLFHKYDQPYIDEFPISKEQPYVFLFDDSKTREQRWKKDMNINEEKTGYLDASKTLKYLSDVFGFPEDLTDEQTREYLSIRSAIYMQRYKKYTPITLAYNVSDDVVVTIEEESHKYIGVFIEVEPLRSYPQGEYFSHIIGYTGKLAMESEIEEFVNSGTYKEGDIIGKTGLEYAYELKLAGKPGDMDVEVNSLGKRISVLKTNSPTLGDDIYLTMDARIQEKAYTILEDSLSETIQNKLMANQIKQTDLIANMVKGNTISADKIMASKEGSHSYTVKKYIDNIFAGGREVDTDPKKHKENIKIVIMDAIKSGSISTMNLIYILYEQGVIVFDEQYLGKVQSGKLSSMQIILDKMRTKEITPQMTNLDPSTGSIVLTDLEGNVIAAVSYPSFDNNELVNNLNVEYYNKISSDPTIPLINRAFKEARAPGSTFKMITGITALENNTITPNTTIYDKVVFEKAGKPYVKSWSKSSFGSVSIAKALEVSNNYFFSDIAYGLGNVKNGTTLNAIEQLNEYMIAFGLNTRAGVEIGEYKDDLPSDIKSISSPEYKKYMTLLLNKDAKESDYKWSDGNLTHTSIGQGYNNYTSAMLVKYIATLATGGNRYALHLVDKVMSAEGDLIEKKEPVLETTVNIKEENLQAIYKGMELVTEGNQGTARSVFSGFPIKVAGKTGTAQETTTRNDHSSFGGFAPIDDPQIAIYVSIPFGDTKTTPAVTSQIAKKVIAEYMGLNDEELQKNKTTINKLVK